MLITECKLKKKNEFGNNCIDVNGFLVKNSFVYIVYTYTFNIMICDKKKKYKVCCLINID